LVFYHLKDNAARVLITSAPWIEQAKLMANDGAADDQFGYSVSISGNTVVVGSPYNDDNGNASGSAYVYIPVDLCECDFEPADGDVNGSDLAILIDSGGIDIDVFAEDYGRTDCP
jgi:hypothetical protein